MTAPASCPTLRIPWPDARDQDGQVNVEKMQENWKALERWASGILGCMPEGEVISGSFYGGNTNCPVGLDTYDIDGYDFIDFTESFPAFFDWDFSDGVLTALQSVWFFVNGYTEWNTDPTDGLETTIFGAGFNQFRTRDTLAPGWDDDDWFQQTSGIMRLGVGQTVQLRARNLLGLSNCKLGQLDIIVLPITGEEGSGGA